MLIEIPVFQKLSHNMANLFAILGTLGASLERTHG